MQRAKSTIVPALIALALLLGFLSPRATAQSLPGNQVPLFQYAVFYNLNLEIDPGAGFPITAPVFSNAGIWSGSPNATFASTVAAVGPMNTSGTDPYCAGKMDNGMPPSNFLYPGQPVSGAVPIYFSNGFYSGTGTTSITNAEALINLPPAPIRAPFSIAYNETNQIYAFNAASLIVSNWYYGTNGVAPWSNNFTVYLQDNLPAPFAVMQDGVPVHWVELTNDFYIYSNTLSHTVFSTNYVPNFVFTNNATAIRWTNNPPGTNIVWYAGFSFLTNASFYDFRENAQVQAVQLDVGKLGAWITNSTLNAGSNWNNELSEDTGHVINSIFIYNAVPFIGQQQLPAVRLVDGHFLPWPLPYEPGWPIGGLTVVTPQPLYVLGDYNVQTNIGGPLILGSHNMANNFSAALMADSITILSSSWVDQTASAAGTYYPTRPASNTTVNAACYEGIVPSAGSSYSGGVESFLRLLQDWAGHTLTYNGSMAAMFPSIYATNVWQVPNGITSYYSIPTRHWAFDTNFLVLDDLPPLTPMLINSNAAPAINLQPTNETVLTGQTTNFLVTASGVPAVAYQWAFHGTNISWGTNFSLVLTNVQLTNAGSYAVQITNVFGTITSSNATLSVYTSAVPVMNALSFSSASGLQFTISGVPGFSYAVLASSNLINWSPLTTNNAPFTFADTNLDSPYRFYRSMYLP